MNSVRSYDIDWLRIIAIGLLLVYHVGIAFQPWGVFIGFIQNDVQVEGLWTLMSVMNIWRIPLLFFVSGMGVCFSFRKRNLKELLLERIRRILVPFIFGILFIVPLHILVWQKYYNQDMQWIPGQGHLWFLLNIFIYVILFSPLFYWLLRRGDSRMARAIRSIFRSPAGFLLTYALFILEVIIISPDIFETYARTLHGFLLGMIAFFLGFMIIYNGEYFRSASSRLRWCFISIALTLFIIRLIFFNLKAPGPLLSIESTSWIIALLGFARRYLNKPGKIVKHLSKAAYPVYIVHMVFLYLASYFVFPIQMAGIWKLMVVIIITTSLSYAAYWLLISRSRISRLLFGLK